LAAVHVVTRALFAATSAAEIVELLTWLVHELGGEVAAADLNPRDALPIDLGLGAVDPLLAVAPQVSVARMQLETLLPSVLEDGRAAMVRLHHSQRLADEASIDMLTGLLNRRGLFRGLASLGIGDCVVLFDLDHFKLLNDNEGHDAGDAALEAFGRLLRGSVRVGDIAGRYGGEELVVGMIRVAPDRAAARVAAIRECWIETKPPVTFSAGLADVRASGARVALAAADRAMYRAKAAGRDRLEVVRDDDY